MNCVIFTHCARLYRLTIAISCILWISNHILILTIFLKKPCVSDLSFIVLLGSGVHAEHDTGTLHWSACLEEMDQGGLNSVDHWRVIFRHNTHSMIS